MSFTRTSQLIMYTAALFVLLLFHDKLNAGGYVGIVVFALMILMVLFAPRIGGQCSKCDSASDVLYGYRCVRCRKRRR
jgi:hypothetical protein